MKKKIYLICYSLVQIIISIYTMFNINTFAEEQLKLVEEMLVGLPEATKAILGQTYTLEAITSSIWFTAVISLILGVILLWLVIRNRISIKKGLAIGLTIGSIVLGLNDIVMVMAVIALILIARTEKVRKNSEIEEKREITKLEPIKVTEKDLLWVVVLILAYSTQFFIPKFIESAGALLIFDILFNVLIFLLVIYIFKNRYIRDFKEFKKNFGSYIGYIFKWWAIMLGLSLIVGIIRIVLGGDTVTANQDALNSAPLWYVGPLAIIWAPVVEEAIFRGGIRRFVKNDILFIIISAVLFGLLHTIGTESGVYNIMIQSLQYAVMGGVMAYVYTKTNNIFVNMGIHCVQNTVGVILMLIMNFI